jgi:hypothetical protein
VPGGRPPGLHTQTETEIETENDGDV